MSEELSALVAERTDARAVFAKARFHRDAAVVCYDSVVAEGAIIRVPAWDFLVASQDAMDSAGDRLDAASTGVIHFLTAAAPRIRKASPDGE